MVLTAFEVKVDGLPKSIELGSTAGITSLADLNTAVHIKLGSPWFKCRNSLSMLSGTPPPGHATGPVETGSKPCSFLSADVNGDLRVFVGPSENEHDITLWGFCKGGSFPLSPDVTPATPFLIGTSKYSAEAYSKSHCRVDVSDMNYAGVTVMDIPITPDMRFADLQTEIFGRLDDLGVSPAAYHGMRVFAGDTFGRACPTWTLAELDLNPTSLFRLGHDRQCTGAKVQLFVKNWRTVAYACHLDSPVEDLKYMIREKEGWPVGALRLIFAGRQLQDGRALEDYNIHSHSTLDVVFRLRAGMLHSTSGRSGAFRELVSVVPCPDLGDTEGEDDPITVEVVLPDCTALRLRCAASTTFDALRRHVALAMRRGPSTGASEAQLLRIELRCMQRQLAALQQAFAALEQQQAGSGKGAGVPGSSGRRTWADVAAGSV